MGRDRAANSRPLRGASAVRIAFVTNLCPHYRRPLYELLGRQHEVDFYFAATGGERYFNARLDHVNGDFTTIDLKRISLLGEPLLPGLAVRLRRSRYDVVVKCLNGRLMVPY